jgi:hypothetical protein
MNQRPPPQQLQIRPSLQFSAKAAIQTASMNVLNFAPESS